MGEPVASIRKNVYSESSFSKFLRPSGANVPFFI